MELIIKRSEWIRGDGSSCSYLLRPSDGKKCCLGFLALQLGASEKDIDGRDSPADSPAEYPAIPWPQTFIGYTDEGKPFNNACDVLILINDSTSLAHDEREESLVREFTRFNINVKFVD